MVRVASRRDRSAKAEHGGSGSSLANRAERSSTDSLVLIMPVFFPILIERSPAKSTPA